MKRAKCGAHTGELLAVVSLGEGIASAFSSLWKRLLISDNPGESEEPHETEEHDSIALFH